MATITHGPMVVAVNTSTPVAVGARVATDG
jgi:hypothetical protein